MTELIACQVFLKVGAGSKAGLGGGRGCECRVRLFHYREKGAGAVVSGRWTVVGRRWAEDGGQRGEAGGIYPSAQHWTWPVFSGQYLVLV